MRRRSSRARVVLPQPDSPTMASVSPVAIARLTSLTAAIRPPSPLAVVANRLDEERKLFFRLRASRRDSATRFTPGCIARGDPQTPPASPERRRRIRPHEHGRPPPTPPPPAPPPRPSPP